MSLRILYAAMDPVPFPKGASVRIEATVRALARTGARVTLLSPSAEPIPGFAARLTGVDHRLVQVEQENFLDRALRFRAAVGSTLEEERWDACMVRSPWEGLPAALARSRNLVYEVHGFPSVELPHHFPALGQRPELLGRLIDQEQELLARAHFLVTPSAQGALYLRQRGADPRRIRIIPNSLCEADFLPPPRAPSEGLLELLYMGTLAPWQGVEVLLEALTHLKGRLPLRLRLAGTRKGPWLRSLRILAQRLRVRSLVEFLGPLDRAALGALLQDCHLCVAPLTDSARNSLQGCCPIKLLEYMAAGQPILSTRLASVEELVTHQESAHLVRPGSPLALAEGIGWLAQHRQEAWEMGLRGRQRARESYFRDRFEGALAGLVAELASIPA